ncbi:MAG: nitroreductase family protein [Bradyrhizobiaceae bacterium]|nr:nitroreductase family protein [Bradyrhizobiaceae bacterium]
MTDRFGEAIELGGAVEEIPFLRHVLGRRTHRAYAPKPVPEPLLHLLVATALSASSKSDFQQASIIRVTDPQKRAALAAPFPAMPWIGASPVFLVFCGDARRLDRIGQLRKHPESNGRLEGFFNAAVDGALVMQTFILAAEAAGLGCCPISVLRNHVDLVAEILGLPDLVFPVAGLCIGYPAADGHLSLRLPPSITVHTDRYDDSELPERLDAYDRARDARHSIPRAQHRNPEKFGHAAFYGWSEDKARQAAQPEGAAFPPWLRRHGFTFE